ncbi:unnamed protein product [Ectocarpus sp. 13 AM-2016]
MGLTRLLLPSQATRLGGFVLIYYTRAVTRASLTVLPTSGYHHTNREDNCTYLLGVQ